MSYRPGRRWPRPAGLLGLLLLLVLLGVAFADPAPADARPTGAIATTDGQAGHQLATGAGTAADDGHRPPVLAETAGTGSPSRSSWALTGGIVGGLSVILVVGLVRLAEWAGSWWERRAPSTRRERRGRTIQPQEPAVRPSPSWQAAERPAPRHRRPWPKAYRRRLIVGVAAAAVLAGVGSAVALVMAPSSPEDAVEAYFAALADRDADRAKGLVAPGYDGNGASDPFLLDGRVLRHAGYHPPRDVHFEHLDLNDPNAAFNRANGTRVVRVAYTVAGTPYHHQLRLIPYEGGRWEQKWRIADPLLSLEIPTGMGTPVVAGALFRTTHRPVLVFPGAYELTLPAQPFLRMEPVTLFAGRTDRVPLRATLLEPGRAEVERQVREHVDACARRTELQLRDCPYEMSVPQLPASAVTRQVVTYPTVQVEADQFGEQLVVTTAQPGRFELTPHTMPVTTRSYPVDFSVGGRVTLVADTVTFTPR
ncbi:hypothetical protein DLJ46_08445 [Micromonospora globispora]|uniref:Uncharacterized protein n=1 Tax=Micromonospora globispora TaxID=1450148 RepID=A0A317KAM4_9ACTN|nr:hypothetical protein [Micromonospora globispora]PWU49902.1 hypothetical protein DLJ46_08445 [Micromonospora globispora]